MKRIHFTDYTKQIHTVSVTVLLKSRNTLTNRGKLKEAENLFWTSHPNSYSWSYILY